MTATYTEPALLDESLHPTDLLDAVAADPLPSRQDDRGLIEAAIAASLAEHGVVHISHVREALARIAGGREVAHFMLGAVISGWAVQHGEHVGWMPNGDTKSGNGAKPARVWRLRTN